MPSVALRAHFDGKQILLDEDYNLPPNAQLMVTLLEFPAIRIKEDWARLSAAGLAGAYGENEPEYSSADIKQ